MPREHSRSWKRPASALAIAASLLAGSAVPLDGQARGYIRGGGGQSTARFVSPTVVASWMSHENYADGGKTTLLVLGGPVGF